MTRCQTTRRPCCHGLQAAACGKALGAIEDAAVPGVVNSAQALLAFSSQSARNVPAPKLSKETIDSSRPFGANIDFRQPQLFGSSDEAVLAMCKAAPGSATAAQPRQPHFMMHYTLGCPCMGTLKHQYVTASCSVWLTSQQNLFGMSIQNASGQNTKRVWSACHFKC